MRRSISHPLTRVVKDNSDTESDDSAAYTAFTQSRTPMLTPTSSSSPFAARKYSFQRRQDRKKLRIKTKVFMQPNFGDQGFGDVTDDMDAESGSGEAEPPSPDGVGAPSPRTRLACHDGKATPTSCGMHEIMAKMETKVRKRTTKRHSTAPANAVFFDKSISRSAISDTCGADFALLIFDWDDTLLPTTFLADAVCPNRNEMARCVLPANSSHLYELQQHAEVVEEVLRAAAALGRVVIVTLGARPWVFTSGAAYLPGIDIPALLEELSIEVYYGREFLVEGFKGMAARAEAFDSWVYAKRRAMANCLKRILRNETPLSRVQVMSIGDSTTEQQALKDVMWDDSFWSAWKDVVLICKTVKMLDEPTLEDLSCELKILIWYLSFLAAHPTDFDFNLSNLSDENGDMKALFGVPTDEDSREPSKRRSSHPSK